MKFLKYNLFWPLICIYIIGGIYVLYVSYATPFINIDLKKQEEEWKIESISYKDWANEAGISIGDRIFKIDNIPINNIVSIEYNPSIRGATELTVQKPSGIILNIFVKHKDIPYQFFMHFIFPSIYFMLALCVAIYLHCYKKGIRNINILVFFILTVALAYISSGASSRADNIGIIINSVCLISCPILLLSFFNNYYVSSKNKLLIKNKTFLYVIPLFTIILCIVRIVYPEIGSISSTIVLILFLLLLVINLIILLYWYTKHKVAQLRALFLGLIVPFLPFLLLFVLPEILLKQPFIAADICALFLLLIPFNIIFLQLTERLFDLDYHISRVRYYFTMASFFTCWLVVGIYFMNDLSLTKLVWIALFIFASMFIFFYLKEKVDYRGRKILFTTKGNHIHKLYQTIQKLSTSYHVDQILQKLTEEVSKHLEVQEVTVVTYEFETNHFQFTNDQVSFIEISKIQSIAVGNIIKHENLYIALIHQDAKYKRWLVIDSHKSIRLKAEELLWLELLLIYTNTLLESMKVIEELVNELQQQQRVNTAEPMWLKKLIWMRVEEEKFQFAQELHDTFLQEHLHIARQMSLVNFEKDPIAARVSLVSLQEQFIRSINNLRTYCETLKPTLLTNIGLHAALERLAERTEERATFTLTTSFDRLYLEDEQLTLMIYRIIQELLNNALKHSLASNVELTLQECDNGFVITYNDDGVGFDTNTIQHSESLGIQGIREKTEAFNGHITLESEPNKGLNMQITIYEGSDEFDFSFNNR
ncbi:ATP-binding protein [Solibacillus sp. CAU 1738]|uniref:ATP-binding protein n=1 Tax=Solibacillus sp. CAU 1738 TaxID=3140363 RepID=UPI0032608B8B